MSEGLGIGRNPGREEVAQRPKELEGEVTESFRNITKAAETSAGKERILQGDYDNDITVVLTTVGGAAWNRAAQQLMSRGVRNPAWGWVSKLDPKTGKTITTMVAGANIAALPVTAPIVGAALEYFSTRAGMPLGDVASQSAAVIGQTAGSLAMLGHGVLGRAARSAEHEAEGITVLQKVLKDSSALVGLRQAAASGNANELIQECGRAIAGELPAFTSVRTTADNGRMGVMGRRSALMGLMAAAAIAWGVLIHSGGKAGFDSGVKTGIEHGIKGKKGDPFDTFFKEFGERFAPGKSEEEIRRTFFDAFQGELEDPFGLRKKK